MILISLKIFAATVVVLGLTSGCSVCEKVVYRPDINQGNYLTITEVEKICIGMKKQQVAYLLGTPMMKDPFGTNTWFYVCRRQINHEQITQQTLILTFNSSDILIRIDNQPILSSLTSS